MPRKYKRTYCKDTALFMVRVRILQVVNNLVTRDMCNEVGIREPRFAKLTRGLEFLRIHEIADFGKLLGLEFLDLSVSPETGEQQIKVFYKRVMYSLEKEKNTIQSKIDRLRELMKTEVPDG